MITRLELPVLHVGVKHINNKSIFIFLMIIIDKYAKYIVPHDLSLIMMERDLEIVVQYVVVKYSIARSQIISDDGT